MDMEDTAETSWFPDQLGMEDLFMSDQYDITDFFDEELSAALGVEHFQNSFPQQTNSFSSQINEIIPRNSSTTSLSASSNMETSQNGIEIPPQLQNQKFYNTNDNTLSPDQVSVIPSPAILSFGNTPAEKINPQNLISTGAMNLEDDTSVSNTNLEEASKSVHIKKKTSTSRIRPPSQTYDHIIAERKRREQLSQQFVALSSIVPGLKKMDKTSVLGDTINYMKHLQEREKALEERAMMQTMESMVLVKKSQLIDEDDDEDHDDKESSEHDHEAAATSSSIEQPLPDIEAKLCDNNVLLRILCEKQKGVLVKILCEMEKINLAVTSTNVAPFGSLALDVTIITEMRKDFNMSMEEVVKALRSSLGRGRPYRS